MHLSKQKCKQIRTKQQKTTALDLKKGFSSGFTLVELLAAVSIIGILSTLALPNYMNAVKKAKQSEVANQISQIQNTIQAYREEYLEDAEDWSDLARITPVATSSGPAEGEWGNPDKAIKTPNGGEYRLVVNSSDEIKFITAVPSSPERHKWDLKACINTNTGFSDIQKGDGITPAALPICDSTN